MKTKANRLVTVLLAAVLTLGLFAGLPPAGNAEAAPIESGPRDDSYNDPANGIYVSPNGDDATATGSVDSPYKSINAALEAASSGGTIILRGGTYYEGINVRIRKPNITIKSKKGEWAVIDLIEYDAGHDEDSGVYFDVDSSGGKLQGVEVRGGYYAVCMETKWNWGGDDDWVAASDITIEDCVLHDSRYDVVKVKPNCDNITIRYNEIYNSGMAFGGDTSGEKNAEGIDNVNGDNMTVHNNYIHDICSNGIYAKGGASNVWIESNRIERVYGAGIMVGFDTSPDFFDLAVNPLYYENIRCTVRNNLIIQAGWEGIGLYGSKDAEIYNNTLVDVVKGGLYHSAIYFGLTYQDWDTNAGRPANINPSIHHNIVCQPSSFDFPMIEIRYSADLDGMSALSGKPDMYDNCYYIVGKSAVFTDNRPDSELEGASLSEWKTHIGGESGSIEVDPAINTDYMASNPQCDGMGIQALANEVPGFDPNTWANPFPDINGEKREWYYEHVAFCSYHGIFGGDEKGRFNPYGAMTRGTLATMLWKLENKPAYSYTNTFSDVKAGDWFMQAVLWAADNGVVSGDGAGKFKPNDLITRQEMAVMLRNYAVNYKEVSIPQTREPTAFSDAGKISGWAKDAVETLYRAEVLNGSGGAFNPQNTATRVEGAAMFRNFMEKVLLNK